MSLPLPTRFPTAVAACMVMTLVLALLTPLAASTPAQTAHRTLTVDLSANTPHQVDGLSPFIMIAASWPAGSVTTAPVEIRTSDGRTASDPTWQRLVADIHQEGGEHQAAPHTGRQFSTPIWVGSATSFEVRATETVRDLHIHLIADHAPIPSASESLLTAAAGNPLDDGRPPIRPRSAWGASTPEEPFDAAASAEFVVLHHTGTADHARPYLANEVPALLRGVQRFHVDGRGWNDIGYNYLIDRFGTIWEGRGGGATPIVSAHAAGYNTGSIGVAFIGDHTTSPPSIEARDASQKLIGWLWFRHSINPDSQITYSERLSWSEDRPSLPRLQGHRDVGSTTCPGHATYPLLGAIERGARAHRSGLLGDRNLSETTITADGGTVTFRGDFDGDGRGDLLVENQSSSMVWFGDGMTFEQQRMNGPAGTTPAAGDFDGDGRDDLLWWSNTGAAETWFGRQDRGFDRAPTVLKFPAEDDEDPVTRPAAAVGDESAGRLPVVADLDGDGDTDVLWHQPGLLNHHRWHGRTMRHFESQVEFLITESRSLSGDVDGDLIDDIVWVENDGRARISFGSHHDVLADGPTLENRLPDGAFLVDADDAEGRDIVWRSGTTTRAVGLGGSRDERPIAMTSNLENPFATGDLDGDGNLEVISAGQGAATIRSRASQDITRSQPSGRPLMVDVNGDGLDDVLWMSPTANTHALWVAS